MLRIIDKVLMLFANLRISSKNQGDEERSSLVFNDFSL